MSADAIQQYMELAGVGKIKPSGENLIGTCPFHEDTRRSFSVNATTGHFICFSASCGEQGNLYAFLVKGCGYSPKKAASIADEWIDFSGFSSGEEWDIDMPSWDQRRREKDEQPRIEESMLGLYEFCPRYMTKQRRFSKSVLNRWEIGYDFEAERVTIPVRNELGELVGISKRTIHKGVDPTYLHLGFKRSHLLYGEFFCPPDAEVWVGEGQFDALALFQMGAKFSLATMSARVGPRQIRRLKRYPVVNLAFDNDKDGRRASMRVGDELLAAGHRGVYVARRYGEFKDPAGLVERGGKKAQRRFMASREPYDLVRLDWEAAA